MSAALDPTGAPVDIFPFTLDTHQWSHGVLHIVGTHGTEQIARPFHHEHVLASVDHAPTEFEHERLG